jgi:hypothetical protein
MFDPSHHHGVPTPGITVQFRKIVDQMGSQGIQMDVADQLSKINLFIAYDGMITVLKQVSVSKMAKVVGHGIACKETPHKSRKPRWAAS